MLNYLRNLRANPRTVRKLRRAGFRRPIRTIQESKRTGLPLSYAMAFLEKESYKGRNVFGSDSVRNPVKGGKVTRKRYKRYLRYRRRGYGCQGVGPMQLTYYALQDSADRLGGCWKPRFNMRVGFRHAKYLIDHYGKFDGVKRYNGSGSSAQAYARDWTAKQSHWHDYLKN